MGIGSCCAGPYDAIRPAGLITIAPASISGCEPPGQTLPCRTRPECARATAVPVELVIEREPTWYGPELPEGSPGPSLASSVADDPDAKVCRRTRRSVRQSDTGQVLNDPRCVVRARQSGLLEVGKNPVGIDPDGHLG